ncbi:MAG: hypothetical protein JW837_05970 [Sedimentisphaerales bacterium]|nr:hypothetical protein [Sedimentisphaerales bacterium]
MKTRIFLIALVCFVIPGYSGIAEAEGLSAGQLSDHGLPAGPASEVLPGPGALVHLQFHDMLSVVEGVEEILVAGIPEKAAPPDVQQLLKTEHPLLTLMGMKTLQQPLTGELLEQMTGINTRGTIGLTLYLGDPRRMFILSLPTRNREPLAPLLSAALQPKVVEEVSVGNQRAVRVVSERLGFLPELYLVSSSDTLYLCGDRSLVQALYLTPTDQRFGQDPFMSRVLGAGDTKQIRMVMNPAMSKPLALQLQGLSMFAKMMIPQQRAALMKKIPQEAKQQMEMRLRMQLGVRDLDQFVDYVECIVIATMEQLVDSVTGRMLAFEGFTMAANLQGGFVEFDASLYSSRFKAEGCTKSLPMDEVKEALAWLGPDYQSFTVTGKKPQPKIVPIMLPWAKRVQQQCAMKKLAWPGLHRYIEMLEELRPIPTVESKTPWILSTMAPLKPAPALKKASNLQEFFVSLELPIYGSVNITPYQGGDFLENCFREEAEILNRNRELNQDFANSFQQQKPWCLHENRFGMTELDGGVRRYTRESVWTTHGGIFGYDQHELVNRKIVHARRVGDYLVYYRGAQASPWLAGLESNQSGRVVSGVTDLLDRVPEGANYVSVQRVLQHLPGCVEWIGELESYLQAEACEYLEEAQAAVDSSSNLEAAKHKIRGMKIPLIIGSVNINPQTKKVYALLPTGNMPLVLPRPKVVPLIQKLFEDYAAQADNVGGGLVYTKVSDESCQFGMMQSTAALTTLTRTVGNALFENYLGTEEQRVQLHRQIMTQHDGDITAFDEVVVRNPQWEFIPQPRAKVPAKLSKKIPSRIRGTDASMVDLSKYYNAALDETWHKGGLSNNTLKDLPRSIQVFDGTSFDIRGIIQLAGRQAERELSVKFPEEVANIAVKQKGQKIHFLHGCGWQSPKGTSIGSYVIHYSNGENRSVPIVYGEDVQDWWLSEEFTSDSKPNIVWRGKNHSSPDGPQIGICKTTWENPLPNIEIEHIDYKSSMMNCAPFLIAITVE